MSGKSIDINLVGVKDQLNTFGYVVGDLVGALKGFPNTADAGSASGERAAIVSTLKAKAENVVAAEQGLSLLVRQVAENLLAGDQDAADVFDKVKDVDLDG